MQPPLRRQGPYRVARDGSGLCAIAVVAMLIGGCAPPTAGPRGAPGPDGAAPALPPIAAREGPIAIDVVYPGEGQTLGTSDSTFIFGGVGTGTASLTINGAPVTVAPNGAFLAFLPVPASGVYDVVATANGQSQNLARQVNLPAPAPPTVSPEPLVTFSATQPGDSARVPGGWEGRVRTSREDGTAIGAAVP